MLNVEMVITLSVGMTERKDEGISADPVKLPVMAEGFVGRYSSCRNVL